MEPLSLAWMAEAAGAECTGPLEGVATGVCTDTRQGCAGAVFVALRGERTDGHRFVPEAASAGAIGAIVERPVAGCSIPQLVVRDALVALGDLARAYAERFAIPKVAVTGSVGKTSVRSMTAAVLSRRFRTLEPARNHNNEIGVPLTLLSLAPGHSAAVVEMAMRGAGQIAYLARIAAPRIGVVTNIGVSHMELLGSQEGIAAAKAELLEALPPDGTAVLPADDRFLPFLRSKTRCSVITFGRASGADFRAGDASVSRDGATRFTVNGTAFAVAAPGEHHALNAAAACAAACVLGVGLDEASDRLRDWRMPEMRMMIRHAAGGLTVLDDCYNAAPDSMRAALSALVSMASAAGRRAVAVLGDMKELGDRSGEMHAALGRLPEMRHVGLLVVVGREAARIGAGGTASQVIGFDDTEDAARHIGGLVGAGDVVLVKGSRAMGMEAIVSALVGVDGAAPAKQKRDTADRVPS